MNKKYRADYALYNEREVTAYCAEKGWTSRSCTGT